MMSPSTSPSSSPLSSSPLSSSPSSPSFFSSLSSSPYISCTLEDCLEEFTSADVLQAVECHVCFSLQIMKAQAEGVSPERVLRRPPYLQQKLFIGRAPPALCLHLRRLLANMQQTFKIELKVNFPMTLDLSPYCLNEQLEEEKQNEKKKTKAEPWNEEEEVFALEEELKKCMKINHLGGADPHKTFSSRSEGFINTGHLSPGAVGASLPNSFSSSASNLFTKSQPIPINTSQRSKTMTPPSTPPPTPTGAPSKQSDKINEILYKLMAVIVHHGSETGGHFTTYRRVANPSVLLSSKDEYRAYVTSNNPSNKQGDDVWVYMSDDNCRIVSDLEEVLNCQAYMLFYEKI